MQIEKLNLERNLKENLKNINLSTNNEIRLFITNEIFENTFGYSFSNITDFLGSLAGTYGLEISATKIADNGINVIFRKDPIMFQEKVQERKKQLEIGNSIIDIKRLN